MLLCVKLSSWAAIPPRARSRSSSRVSRSSTRPRAISRSPSRDDAVVDPDPLAVADRGPVLRAEVVDQQDAGVRQHAGAEGGVATGDEPHPVDDGGDLRVDELLGGGPVEVEVVDDGDVAATQPGQQAAGPPVDLGGAGEPGQGGVEA